MPNNWNQIKEPDGKVYFECAIEGIPVRVRRKDDDENGEITETYANLTSEQYHRLVSHFGKKDISWEKSCPTYILQNAMASYEESCLHEITTKADPYKDEMRQLAQNMRSWAGLYAGLEGMVNNFDAFPDPLGTLLFRLELLKDQIENAKPPMPERMKADLLKGLDAFTKQAKDMQGKATRQEIRNFLLIQPMGDTPTSLGEFVANQMKTLYVGTKREAYLIGDKHSKVGWLWNRVWQLLTPDKMIRHLSDGGFNLDRKYGAMHGIAANTTREATPVGMVESLCTVNHQKNDDPKWVSLGGYMPLESTLQEKHTFFTVLSKGAESKDAKNAIDTINKKEKGRFGANVLTLLAIPLEVVVVGVVRIPAIPIMGLAYLVERGWNRLRGGKDYQKRREAIDKRYEAAEESLSNFSRRVSPLIMAKNYRENGRQITTPGLAELQIAESGLNKFANFMRGSTIGRAIADGIGGARKEKTATKEKNKTKDDRKALVKAFRENTRAKYKEAMLETHTNPPPDMKDSTTMRFRTGVEPCALNEYTNPFAIIDEVFTGMGDVILSPMFRKSPALAVVFFVFAHATFGALTVPGVFGSNAASLTEVSRWIAMKFLGQQLGGSTVNDFAAAFLQFKLPLLVQEGFVEMDMQSILNDPEIPVMSLAALLGSTYMLGNMHQLLVNTVTLNLPSTVSGIPYAGKYLAGAGNEALGMVQGLTNFFAEETRIAQLHGTVPFTSLEFAFLAFKLGGLVHSMVDSSGDPNQENLTSDEKKFLALLQGEEQKKVIDDLRTAVEGAYKSGSFKGFNSLSDVPEDVLKGLIRSTLMTNDIENPTDKMINDLYGALKSSCEDTNKAVLGANALHASIAMKSAPNSPESTDDKKSRLEANADAAQGHLNDLIRDVQMNLMTGGTDPKSLSLKTAKALYDDLYEAFKLHNDAQVAAGHPEKVVPKNVFLDAFYNRYIEPHEKSMAIVELARSIGARAVDLVANRFPIVKNAMRSRLGTRTKNPSDSAHARMRTKKRAARDEAWAYSIPAFTARGTRYEVIGTGMTIVGGVGGIGVTLVGGIGAAVWGGLVTGPLYVLGFKETSKKLWEGFTKPFKRVFESVADFSTAAEDINAPKSMKRAYAQAAHTAGTSSALLESETDSVLKKLKDNKEVKEAGAQIDWLEGYDRKYKKENIKVTDQGEKRGVMDQYRTRNRQNQEKTQRREEKALFTSYAEKMSELFKKVRDLEKRVDALYQDGRVVQEIREIKSFMEDSRNNPPRADKNGFDKMKTRKNEAAQYMQTLAELEAKIKPEEFKHAMDELKEINNRLFTQKTPLEGAAKTEFDKQLPEMDDLYHKADDHTPGYQADLDKGLIWVKDQKRLLLQHEKRVEKEKAASTAIVHPSSNPDAPNPNQNKAVQNVQAQMLQKTADKSKAGPPETLQKELQGKDPVIGVVSNLDKDSGKDHADIYNNFGAFGNDAHKLVASLDKHPVRMTIGEDSFWVKGVILGDEVAFVQVNNEKDPAGKNYISSQQVKDFASEHEGQPSFCTEVMRLHMADDAVNGNKAKFIHTPGQAPGQLKTLVAAL